MKHQPFRDLLCQLDELTMTQKCQAVAVLTVSDIAQASIVTIEMSVDESRICPHCQAPRRHRSRSEQWSSSLPMQGWPSDFQRRLRHTTARPASLGTLAGFWGLHGPGCQRADRVGAM